MPRWYDRQGRPITMQQAEALLVDIDARRVALDEVGRHEVSTVHLVLDHSMGRPWYDGPPLIFETMVFVGDGHPADDEGCDLCDTCVRTPTETAALAMHDQVCAEVRDQQEARR